MLVFLGIFTPLASTAQAQAAAAREYYISNYNINVTINGDGSANVEERVTYNFTGQFNGVTMDIDSSGTNGLEQPKVFIDRNGTMQEVLQNDSSEAGTYTLTKEGTIDKFKVYEPSTTEQKTFIYQYKLLDAVTRYNDIAEFNRKLIGTGWTTRIDNVFINITIPLGATRNDVRIFAHGPLIGESSILDARNVKLTVSTVSPGTFVEARLLFPTKLVPQSHQIVQQDQLQNILNQEAGFAKQANQQRADARTTVANENTLKMVGSIFVVLLFLIGIGLLVWIYWKFDKELKSSFNAKYYRELPGEYTPAEMSVLMYMGSVNPRDIMATLLDLVRKRQLLITATSIDKKVLFWDKKEQDYTISINAAAPSIELKPHESLLINWFIHDIGDGQSVLLGDLRDYVKDKGNALKFKADYDGWVGNVVFTAESNNFYDKTNKKSKTIGMLVGALYVGLGLLFLIMVKITLSFVLIILGVVMVIYAAALKKRTAYGNDQYRMWEAFKRFLKDFSQMDKAEIPSLILWEYYLVYAVSLGVAKEVIKQLPMVFREEDLNDPGLTFFNGMMVGAAFGYFSHFSNMFDSTIHTVEGAITSAQSIANSQNSSSSGSGGGFSGGSSGGGGGGGGGGAF